MAKAEFSVRCSCKSEFQDSMYGSGTRVATPIHKSTVNGVVQTYRCTVCGTLHQKGKK